jgi:hypothetical protein
MLPEDKFNQWARWKFHVRRLRSLVIRTERVEQNPGAVLRHFSNAKNDVLEYFQISETQFWDLVLQWPKIEEELFLNKVGVDEFYRSWSGENARANICANVFNQYLSQEIYHVAKKFSSDAKTFLDFGCGTASLSLAIAGEARGACNFVLSDVQQEIRDFVDYRVKTHALLSVKTVDIFKLDKQQSFDFVMCIDVLEHLENAAQVFCEELLPRVAVGGLLFLRAPWRGQLTHIDAAADNFYLEGGREALSRCFSEVFRVGPSDIDAVYRRVR